MESSRGSLRFDEFPTSMKRRNPFGSRATRLLAYENARPSESRLPALLQRPARKDSAVRVSLSSYHNVKEPSGHGRCRLPNPRWKQIHHQESTTAAASPESDSVKLRSCQRIARSRIVPQEVGATRAKHSSKRGPSPCQEVANRFPPLFAFHLDSGIEATFLPECAFTMHSLTAR